MYECVCVFVTGSVDAHDTLQVMKVMVINSHDNENDD